MDITLKKTTELKCTIARNARCKISVIFRVIALSPNTQPFKNKFIPYHLIISKHKYHVIKYMFHALFLHYILWSLRFLWHLSTCITNVFKGGTKSSQFFNQLFKIVFHEKLNDWKMTSKKLCILLFLHDLCLLSVDSVYVHIMADSVRPMYCIWVDHNIADDSLDGSYHFGLHDSNGLLVQVQHWRDVIRHKVAGSINRLPLHFTPPHLSKDREQSVFYKVGAQNLH
jgi:hypothetical protein